MTHNFNLKIITGKKTGLSVEIYSTAYTTKNVEFKDKKKTISNKELAKSIGKALNQILNEWADKQT